MTAIKFKESKPLGLKQQEGAILLVSLILLVIITIITLSTSQTVFLQQRMTSSTRDAMVVLEAAEQALYEGEQAAAAATYTVAATNGLWDGTNCDIDSANCYIKTLTDVYAAAYWDAGHQTATTGISCGANCGTIKGDYIVINLGEMTSFGLQSSNEISVITDQYVGKTPEGLSNAYRYKIVARAKGPTGITKVVSSYYAAVPSAAP